MRGLLLIETAGGVISPLDDNHTMRDLVAALRPPSVLVTASYLGAISHTLTAARPSPAGAQMTAGQTPQATNFWTRIRFKQC